MKVIRNLHLPVLVCLIVSACVSCSPSVTDAASTDNTPSQNSLSDTIDLRFRGYLECIEIVEQFHVDGKINFSSTRDMEGVKFLDKHNIFIFGSSDLDLSPEGRQKLFYEYYLDEDVEYRVPQNVRGKSLENIKDSTPVIEIYILDQDIPVFRMTKNAEILTTSNKNTPTKSDISTWTRIREGIF